MGVIAKYKFNNTLEANLLPEFNSGFTSDLYTVTDVVDGEVTTRTIESDSLPTLMRFGRLWVEGETDTDNRTDSLLEVLDMDTNGLTNCSNMFRYCKNLTSITCEWDTSKVTNMYGMFANCYNLTSLDVSNFDTSNVTNMRFMFSNCNNLTSLDVSNFDTSNVTRMDYMFQYCNKLTSLDLSNFNTSKVTDISWMFRSCNNLTSLDVSNFNTSNVTDTTNMFNNTPLLADIGVLYMDKSSLQKLVNTMPTDSNKTLWYKDVDIDGITHGDNIALKKYIEENVEIVLNSPLLKGDTIEVKDGKLCHVHRWEKIVLDGSEDWTRYASGDITSVFCLKTWKGKLVEGINFYCNRFPCIYGSWNVNNSREGTQIDADIALTIQINNNKLSTQDVNGFKQWLQTNPTTVVYELETPIYEDITPLQSSIALRTFEECNIQIITALPIKTKITYRTNITSAVVMEQELDTLDSGVSLSNLIEEEVDE